MKLLVGAACLWLSLFSPLPAAAQTADAPALKAGDAWTYRMTVEKGPSGWTQTREDLTITRVTASTVFFQTKASGSNQPPKDTFLGSDWSRSRDVNGKEVVVNRPLVFPLAAGKSWELSYEEKQPNAAHKWERIDNRYVVAGYETVEVPAGTFRALKIESEGQWHAELATGQTVAQVAQASEQSTTMVTEARKTAEKVVQGRTYKAFWYAPEVKRWVKSVEEYYSSGGVRNERYTQELESFRAAP